MKRENEGFTLIELMVAILISTVVLYAIYAAFMTQEKSQTEQQQILTMQQNIRAAMHVLSTEIREVGFDKSMGRNSGAGFWTGEEGESIGAAFLRITMDTAPNGNTDGLDNDNDGTIDETDEKKYGNGYIGEANENIEYRFDPDDDADLNGIADKGIAALQRQTYRDEDKDGVFTKSGLLPLAEGIQAIRFTYLDEDGDDLDSDGDGVINDNDLDEIRAVRIAILGRSKSDLRELQDTNTYDMNGDLPNNSGDIVLGPFNDTYRRRLLITTVKCRNMGLE